MWCGFIKGKKQPANRFVDKEHSIEEADKIYRAFIDVKDEDIEARNIFINSGWGTGKSTIKQILIDKIKEEKKHIKLVSFDAIQLEESSQVTSNLYYTIAGAFSRWNPFCFSPRAKFRAIGYLKKESNSSNLSMTVITQLLMFGLISFFITKVSKAEWLNSFLTFKYGVIKVNDPAFNNKLFLLFVFLVWLYLRRDNFLMFFSSKLPRTTHIDILKKIEFKTLTGKPGHLVIFVDEIDRINDDAAKLLLNELLIIREMFNYRKNAKSSRMAKCTIILFSVKSKLNDIYANDNSEKDFIEKYFLQYDILPVSVRDILIKGLDKYLGTIRSTYTSMFNNLYICLFEQIRSYRNVESYFARLQNQFETVEPKKILMLYINSKRSTFITEAANNPETQQLLYNAVDIIAVCVFSSLQYDNVNDKLIGFINTPVDTVMLEIEKKLLFKNIFKYSTEIIKELVGHQPMEFNALNHKKELLVRAREILDGEFTYNNIHPYTTIITCCQNVKATDYQANFQQIAQAIIDDFNYANEVANAKSTYGYNDLIKFCQLNFSTRKLDKQIEAELETGDVGY